MPKIRIVSERYVEDDGRLMYKVVDIAGIKWSGFEKGTKWIASKDNIDVISKGDNNFLVLGGKYEKNVFLRKMEYIQGAVEEFDRHKKEENWFGLEPFEF
jgi:hypothetical protein